MRRASKKHKAADNMLPAALNDEVIAISYVMLDRIALQHELTERNVATLAARRHDRLIDSVIDAVAHILARAICKAHVHTVWVIGAWAGCDVSIGGAHGGNRDVFVIDRGVDLSNLVRCRVIDDTEPLNVLPFISR